jgi:hypothetical protein
MQSQPTLFQPKLTIQQQLAQAQTHVNDNQIDQAILIYRSMIESLSKIRERDNTVCAWLALVKNNLAKLYFSKNDFAKAGNFLMQAVHAIALVKQDRLQSTEQKNEFYGISAQCSGNLAMVYAKLNKREQSNERIDQALEWLSQITSKSEEDNACIQQLLELKDKLNATATPVSYWQLR